MKFRCFISFLFCFWGTLLVGNSQEKLYLHLDRTYFMAGETLWFKGYLANADLQDETPESNFIYVELLKDTLIVREKVKREGLGFPGYISLPASLPAGNYVLRAYTRWQMNWPVEQMFHQHIKISESGKEGAGNPFYSILSSNSHYGNKSVLSDANAIDSVSGAVGKEELQHVNCSVVFDKAAYGKRDRVTAQVLLTNEKGEPLEGEYSVSVVRGVFRNYSQRYNINGYMSLWNSSFGVLGMPYGREGENNMSDGRTVLQREYTQSLAGYIYNKRGSKIMKHNVNFISLAAGYSNSVKMNTGDSVILDSLDFPDSTKFSAIFRPTGGDRFRWQRDTFAVWNIELANDITDPAFIEDGYRESVGMEKRNMQRIGREELAQDVFLQRSVQMDTLKTLTVTAHKESPFVRVDSPTISPLGQQVFERRSVTVRSELDKYSYMNLIDYIVSYKNFGRKGLDKDGVKTVIHTRVQGTLNVQAEPLLYIDGLKEQSTSVLNYMSLNDVETLVILRGVEGALYKTVAGVILVELRNARNIKYTPGYNRNSVSITPLGYQRPGYFSMPVYNTPAKRQSTVPDRRNTIYWNPSLCFFPDGKSYFSFYSSDEISASYYIRIEGMTPDRRPFSWKGEVPVF